MQPLRIGLHIHLKFSMVVMVLSILLVVVIMIDLNVLFSLILVIILVFMDQFNLFTVAIVIVVSFNCLFMECSYCIFEHYQKFFYWKERMVWSFKQQQLTSTLQEYWVKFM